MAEEITDQFRRLVRCYSDGLVGKDEYRRLRRNLIDASDESEVAGIDNSKSTRPEVTVSDSPTCQPAPGRQETGNARDSQLAPARRRQSIALVIVIVIGVALSVWFGKLPVGRDRDAATQQLNDVSWQTKELERARVLLMEFVEEPAWSGGSIRTFLYEWSDLHPNIRRAVAREPLYAEAVARMQARLSDEAIDQGPAAVENSSLRQELARRFRLETIDATAE